MGGGRYLFNTLEPSEEHASNIDRVVNHRDWIMVTFTQPTSILFPLTYKLFILFSRACSHHIPVWVGPSLYLTLVFFVVIFALLSLTFLQLAPRQNCCWTPWDSHSPSFIHSLQHTYWVYPNKMLQHPTHLHSRLVPPPIILIWPSQDCHVHTYPCTHTTTNTQIKLPSHLHPATVAVWRC